MTTAPTPQPEALADRLEDMTCLWSPSNNRDLVNNAAIELRRLDSKVFELQELLKNRDETSTYRAWTAMRARCENRSDKRFARYGGRGITVCDRWADYTNFLQDMGIRPPGKTLDRIDNDGIYEPGNCRWATQEEQRRNTSRNRNYEYQGRTMCLTDWADELGLSKNTIRSRIDDQGMSFEQAISTPLREKSRRKQWKR